MGNRFEFDKVHGNKRSSIGRKGQTVYVDLFFNFWSLFYCFSVDRYLFIHFYMSVCVWVCVGNWVIKMKKKETRQEQTAVLQPDIKYQIK